MHSILLVIERPKQNANQNLKDAYRKTLLDTKEAIEDDPTIEWLAENVLLFEVNSSLRSFCKILALGKFSYKCIFFEDKPEWVTGSMGNDLNLDRNLV